MGINRIRLQAGSPAEMAKAEAAAAQDPALDRIRQQLFGEGYVQDIGEGKGIAQYYSGFGLPQSLAFTPAPVEEVAPVADVIEPVVETGGGGGGGGGGTGDITTPDVGDAPINTVKQAMTQDAAYSLPGQSDPFLASGAAGGARLPATQAITTLPSGDVFATDDPMLAEKIDYTEQDPTFWEKARDKFVTTGQDVGGFFGDLKDKGIDVAKMAGSAIMNMIAPGLGLLTKAESASGAQQDLVRDQFVDEGVVLDDIGRIVQQPGLAYDTPENVMAGYTPGQTGAQIGDVKIGGNIIQESIVDRLSTLEKTKNEKYDGSFYNADGTPKNNPDTGQPTTLGAREEALKENLNMVARAAGAVTLEDYDPISKKAGETTYATDVFPDLDQEKTAPVTIEDERKALQEELEGYRDPIIDMEPAESVDLGNPFNDPRIVSEELGLVGTPQRPTMLDIAGPTIDDTRPEMLGDVGFTNQDLVSQALGAALHGEGGGDVSFGGRDESANVGGTTPSGATTGDVYGGAAYGYNEAAEKGNQGGGGGGGKIVCTMMNESYGFGSFRNKIWLRHSKDLAPEYQIGYHKIFLPLVRLSKTNKLLKKTLEHIAVHRTIDIRQEARGKVHLLGRVYRKVLEPICYWVGKYAKR